MRKLYPIFLLVFMFGCQFNDDPKLPPVEERVSDAIEEMEDLLVAPANGWRIDYRPNSLGGDYLIIMDFDRQGNVRIQSDVPANDGEFRDHIISYRIDVGSGVELVLETYGVFHYLFELNETSFGGEFEFIFDEEDNGNLVFDSKTDGSVIVFQPAASTDPSLISTEAITLLQQGIFRQQNLAGAGNFVQYNMYLQDIDATVSMAMDLDLRRISIQGIVAGQSIDEILSSPSREEIDHSSVFSIRGEDVVLANSRSISFQGNQITFDRIPIENIDRIASSFCTGQVDSLTTFTSGNAAGLGNFTLTSSLAATHSNFGEDSFGNVNAGFIYDENDDPISDAITALLPDVVAFQVYNGVPLNDGSTLRALGWITVDELNNVDFIFREYEYSQQGNLATFNFLDTFFRQDQLSEEQMDAVTKLTDLIFEGNQVYLLEALTIEGLIEFYNPCNRHKGFFFLEP
ncbi:MAG: DUF4302 domain-containing protein [Cytophagales bacterium]|nr:DUF4302 domain-containing protein [Cytophagales bacterium]